MITKTVSERSLSIINQYLHFKIGAASCSIPYFNNKTKLSRFALRVSVGKGSPEDISDEAHSFMAKSHIAIDSLTTESLKKTLVDHNLGIDCSGFAYYVLDAESIASRKINLKKRLSFTNCRTLFDNIRCSLRPIENCDVSTFADNKNSFIIDTKDILPGDIITMLNNQTENKFGSENSADHILIVDTVEYTDSTPIKIHYSHAAAYPEDGVYNTGIKQGEIDITNPNKTIIEQSWTEDDMNGNANRIYLKAKKSRTEIRRIK